MNHKITRNMEIDPEAKIYNPRKDMAIGSLIRTMVMIAIFVSAIVKADVKNNANAMWDILFTVFGYTTYRIIFIVCLIIFRDKEDEIKWVNFGNRSLVSLIAPKLSYSSELFNLTIIFSPIFIVNTVLLFCDAKVRNFFESTKSFNVFNNSFLFLHNEYLYFSSVSA